MKRNLFITKSVIISRDSKTIKLEFDDDKKVIPISVINSLFLIGSQIELTNGARGLLLENNREIFFLVPKLQLGNEKNCINIINLSIKILIFKM